MRRELTAGDFGSPGQKIRCSAEAELFRSSLKKGLTNASAGAIIWE